MEDKGAKLINLFYKIKNTVGIDSLIEVMESTIEAAEAINIGNKTISQVKLRNYILHLVCATYAMTIDYIATSKSKGNRRDAICCLFYLVQKYIPNYEAELLARIGKTQSAKCRYYTTIRELDRNIPGDRRLLVKFDELNAKITAYIESELKIEETKINNNFNN